MNVLIVDDQKDVVHSIRNSIDWKKFSIKNVHIAFSGEEARRVLKEHVIDIMLCDIEMPRESGLELLGWLRSWNQSVECIFLTAHADFGYAKEALQLGSFDYILQPAKPIEIEEAIHKVCLKITQKKEIRKLQNTQGLLDEQKQLLLDGMVREHILGEKEAKGRAQDLFHFLEEGFHEMRMCPVLIHITRWKTNLGEWESTLVRNTLDNILREIFAGDKKESLLSRVDKNHFYYILCYENEMLQQNEIIIGLKRFQEFIMQYMEFEVAIYYDDTVRADGLPRMLRHLMNQSKNNVMLISKVFYDYSVPMESESGAGKYLLHMDKWETWMLSGMGEMIKNEIVNYIQEMQSRDKMSIELLKKLHTNFTKSFYCALGNHQVNAEQVFNGSYTYEQYLAAYHHYQTLMEAIDYILSFMEQLNESKMEPESDQIEKVILYIRSNLDKNITRSEVASHVFINPEYLSRLFKKRTGYMLKDFILHEKMEYAKFLLKTTDLSISIIASKVGYSNFSHFSKAFRRAEDTTPQDYRQNHKKEGI